MSLEFLKVDSACTVIRLSQTTMKIAPLVDQVEPILAQNSNLIIDAHGLSFSSMELGELANLADEFLEVWKGKVCHMAIVNLSPSAKSVFTVTKLDKIFPIFDSISAALDQFSASGMPELKAAQ